MRHIQDFALVAIASTLTGISETFYYNQTLYFTSPLTNRSKSAIHLSQNFVCRETTHIISNLHTSQVSHHPNVKSIASFTSNGTNRRPRSHSIQVHDSNPWCEMLCILRSHVSHTRRSEIGMPSPRRRKRPYKVVTESLNKCHGLSCHKITMTRMHKSPIIRFSVGNQIKEHQNIPLTPSKTDGFRRHVCLLRIEAQKIWLPL
jgi:hypothetical protein